MSTFIATINKVNALLDQYSKSIEIVSNTITTSNSFKLELEMIYYDLNLTEEKTYTYKTTSLYLPSDMNTALNAVMAQMNTAHSFVQMAQNSSVVNADSFTLDIVVNTLFNDTKFLKSITLRGYDNLDVVMFETTQTQLTPFNQLDAVILLLSSANIALIQNAPTHAQAVQDLKDEVQTLRDETEGFKDQAQSIAGGDVVSDQVKFLDTTSLTDWKNFTDAILQSDDLNYDTVQERLDFLKQLDTEIDTLALSDVAETATLKHFTDALKTKLENLDDNGTQNPTTLTDIVVPDNTNKLLIGEVEFTTLSIGNGSSLRIIL